MSIPLASGQSSLVRAEDFQAVGVSVGDLENSFLFFFREFRGVYFQNFFGKLGFVFVWVAVFCEQAQNLPVCFRLH